MKIHSRKMRVTLVEGEAFSDLRELHFLTRERALREGLSRSIDRNDRRDDKGDLPC